MAAAVAETHEFRGAVTTSFILHGVILLAAIIGLPHLKPPPLELSQPIAIDIVDVGPVTTTQVQGVGQIAKQNDNAPAPLPPPPKLTAAKPPVTPAKAGVQDERKALEDIIGSEIKKNKDDKPKPKAEQPQFDSLLKDLSQPKDQTTPGEAAEKKATGPAAGSAGIKSDKLTISQEDALRRQIEQCWNIPTGARDAQDMIVEVHIVVNPDRTVQSAEVIGGNMSDPFYRAAAESAKRAILNPKCSPLQLPEGREADWHEMTLRFNPKDVL